MAVTIHLSSLLRDFSRVPEFELEAQTVRAALAEMARRYPSLHRGICDETGAVRRHVNVWVNRHNIRDAKGLDTPLAPGDVVMILQAVSGG